MAVSRPLSRPLNERQPPATPPGKVAWEGSPSADRPTHHSVRVPYDRRVRATCVLYRHGCMPILTLQDMISALRNSSHVRGATCRTFRQSVNAHALSTAGAPAAARPKVLVLAGTTCVGKTAVALELAQMLDGEVVNADSVQARARSRHAPWTCPFAPDASATHLQVYQGLNIGSAKIPESERRGALCAASSVSPIGTAEP